MSLTLRIHIAGAQVGFSLAENDGAADRPPETPAECHEFPDAIDAGFGSLGDLRRLAISRVDISPAGIEDPQVEDAGLPVGFVLIGFAVRATERLAPAARLCVGGQVGIGGEIITPLDEEGLASQLAAFVASNGLVAMVVSGINSNMNAVMEKRAAELARSTTGLPVLEARYLTTQTNAVTRALSASRLAQWMLIAHELARTTRARLADAGAMVPVRFVVRDQAHAAALAAAGIGKLIAGVGASLVAMCLETQARVTRAARHCYACHCEDGRYEFDSLQAAKEFGEQHARDLVIDLARRLSLAEQPVEVSVEDRFGQGQGRKGPMRVFLESQIIATCRPAAKS